MNESRTIKTKVFASIRDVPRQQWNDLTGKHSCSLSWEFWELIEKSGLNDFSYRHVLFYDDAEKPVALTSFYSITTDIAIFAPAGLRKALAGIRRVFPNFFKLRMLECGAPITVNSPPFAVDAGVSEQDIIKALSELLLATAKKEKHLLIVIRDFEPNAAHLQRDFEKRGYHWVESLPNTYMDIQWSSPEDYRSSMKSYYRSKLLKHLRRNEEQNIRHELVDDFADLAETLCAQWMVVHNHAAEFQREVLTPDFYRRLSSSMGARSKALLFYQQEKLVGHALLLADGDLLRWLYFGRTEAENDSLYIYVGNAVIESAILLGAKRLELGLTTYPVKKDLGAQMTPIMLALRTPYSFANPLVGWIYPLVNHTPPVHNRNIFKGSGKRRNAK
ncbi:MAG: GNAT family N-acetyltransferase [Alphaproteobacteria bacterium]|nr:GNAT family N-acetyltransferase [Alphaproteobacteria bacterium]